MLFNNLQYGHYKRNLKKIQHYIWTQSGNQWEEEIFVDVHSSSTRVHFMATQIRAPWLADEDICLKVVISRPGVADVVELGDNSSEEGEGGTGREDSLPDGLARGRVLAEDGPVLGVIRIPHRSRQQAHLGDYEEHPEKQFDGMKLKLDPRDSNEEVATEKLICLWKRAESSADAYQQVKKRMIAQAREPLGLIGFPQQKQRLATIMMTWLSIRNRNAPTPYPVAMSESYTQ